MRLIDTHCHLYVEDFAGDIDAVMNRAVEAGISEFYMPAIDSTETENLIATEQRFPGKCFAMMGLHPCSVKENYKEELDKVEELLGKRTFAAIGESGLDYYWDKTFIPQQIDALKIQANWALKYDIPIVLHTRDAMQETIDVIKEFAPKGIRGIFHCFGGSIVEARQIIEMGFYLGIGGVLTYKKSGLAELLADIDMSHLVLETDAPYLTPVPFRGKRNESSYLKLIAEKLAEVKNISLEEVANITTENAERVFRKG
jgi:TatD DNase family protein